MLLAPAFALNFLFNLMLNIYFFVMRSFPLKFLSLQMNFQKFIPQCNLEVYFSMEDQRLVKFRSDLKF